MKKITELTETRWRTIHLRDAYGNLERDTEEYVAKSAVKSIMPGPRFGHFIIDLIAFQILMYVVTYIFELIFHATNSNISLNLTVGLANSITILLLYPAFYVVCEFWWQRTPGKILTKTLVVDEYGKKPALGTIVLRSMIRLVPLHPISCYGDKYSFGWHDSWSKTWVVSEDELKELKKLQEEQQNTG